MPERSAGAQLKSTAGQGAPGGSSAKRTKDRKAPREASFELLRIVLMLMIVTLHYLNQGGFLLEAGCGGDTACRAGNVIEAFSIGAVNAFVLMSGYFLSAAKTDVRRAGRFYAQVWFYSCLVPLVLGIFGVPVLEEGLYSVLRYVFPVLTEHYWFATAYFVMLLLSPVMNAFLERAERPALLRTLLVLLAVFSGVKSVCPAKLVFDRYGYDFGWFLVLYLTGGALRRFPELFPKSRAASAALYLGSGAGIAAAGAVLYSVHERTGALAYYMNVPFHYNFLLAYTEALGLFFLFRGMRLPEGRFADTVRALSPGVFGVYLLHANSALFDRWYPAVCAVTGSPPRNLLFVFHLAFSLVPVSAVGFAADWVRRELFRAAGTIVNTKPGRKTGRT